MDLRDATDWALRQTKRGAATDAEVVAAEGDHLGVGIRLGELETLKRARERRIALRVFVGRSSAVCSTADLTPQAVADLAEQACALARATAPDPFSGLPDESPEPPSADSLDLHDPAAESIRAEEAIDWLRRAEGAALGADPRIVNSEGGEFNAATRCLIYATSRGVQREYVTSSCSLSVVPVASEAGAMQRDYWYTAARHLADLESAETVGRRAAARTVRRLGARPVRTCEVPVVFDPETAASLLGHFAAAACGSSIYRGTSFLKDRIGASLGPAMVTVIDDPRLPRGLGSRPFDAEGLPTRRNVVFRRGCLETYLLDTYSARKLGMRSTASAVRTLGDVPSAGTSNFYVENGSTSPEQIIASVADGFYVTELIGFGVNPVTGDYSRGAVGSWIEGGRLSFPVQEVTIAGNLLEMFRAIEMVGNDLEFRSTIASPTLKVARMTVAGEG